MDAIGFALFPGLNKLKARILSSIFGSLFLSFNQKQVVRPFLLSSHALLFAFDIAE